jgi:hypothetical protein
MVKRNDEYDEYGGYEDYDDYDDKILSDSTYGTSLESCPAYKVVGPTSGCFSVTRSKKYWRQR